MRWSNRLVLVVLLHHVTTAIGRRRRRDSLLLCRYSMTMTMCMHSTQQWEPRSCVAQLKSDFKQSVIIECIRQVSGIVRRAMPCRIALLLLCY